MKSNELIRELRHAGWYTDRQSGSHMIMKHPDRDDFLVVPNHGSKEVGKGLEQRIRRQAGLR